MRVSLEVVPAFSSAFVHVNRNVFEMFTNVKSFKYNDRGGLKV